MKTTSSLKTVVFAIIKLRKTISGPSGIQNLHYYITGYTKKRRLLWKTAKLFMEEEGSLILTSSMKSTKKIKFTELAKKVNLNNKKGNRNI